MMQQVLEIDLEQVIRPIDLAVDQKGNLYVLDQNNSAIIQFENTGILLPHW